MMRMKPIWAKAYLMRPRDNILSHVLLKSKKFMPSFETNPCPAPMNWLLGWEYARIWQRERDEYIKQREKLSKPKFIRNDYENWLLKRQAKAKKFC